MRITQTLLMDTSFVGQFVIGHFRCARSNSVKNRACQELIRFQNYVIAMITANILRVVFFFSPSIEGARNKYEERAKCLLVFYVKPSKMRLINIPLHFSYYLVLNVHYSVIRNTTE